MDLKSESYCCHISCHCFKTLMSFQLRIKLNEVSWSIRRHCWSGLYHSQLSYSCALLSISTHTPWTWPSPFPSASTCPCYSLCQRSSSPFDRAESPKHYLLRYTFPDTLSYYILPNLLFYHSIPLKLSLRRTRLKAGRKLRWFYSLYKKPCILNWC